MKNYTSIKLKSLLATGLLSGSLFSLNASDLTVAGNLTVEDTVLASGTEGAGSIPAPGVGTSFLWSPGKSALRGGYVSTDAWNDSAIGLRSTAFGSDVNASSFAEFAVGQFNTSLSGTSGSWVSSDALFVVGNGTSDSARSNALTVYKNGNAEISGSLKVSGLPVVLNTGASGINGNASLGHNTKATQVGSFAAGESTKAYGDHSTALGFATKADGKQALAAGRSSEAAGRAATALGYDTRAGAIGTLSAGESTRALGDHAISLGFGTRASGKQSFATGRSSEAAGKAAAAFGYDTRAGAVGAFSAGEATRALNDHAVALGFGTRAEGKQALAIGRSTVAKGRTSVALGYTTIAGAENSFAVGRSTNASSFSSVAMGQFNSVIPGNTLAFDASDTLFTLGNGVDESNRSNAVMIMKNGNTLIGFDSSNPSYVPTKSLEVVGDSSISGELSVGDVIVNGALNVQPQGDIPMFSY